MKLTYRESHGAVAVAAMDEDGDLHIFNEDRGSTCILLSVSHPTSLEFEPNEYVGKYVHYFYPGDQLTITF